MITLAAVEDKAVVAGISLAAVPSSLGRLRRPTGLHRQLRTSTTTTTRDGESGAEAPAAAVFETLESYSAEKHRLMTDAATMTTTASRAKGHGEECE